MSSERPMCSRQTRQKVPLTDGRSRSGPLDEQWRPRGPVHWERKPFPDGRWEVHLPPIFRWASPETATCYGLSEGAFFAPALWNIPCEREISTTRRTRGLVFDGAKGPSSRFLPSCVRR